MDPIKESAGLNWYYEVHQHCKLLASLYNIPLIKVAGIMSALSPNNTFALNLRSTQRFLETNGDCKVSTYNTQKEKALLILALDNSFATVDTIKYILGKSKDSALKTKAFFDNIYRPEVSTDVTIDRWMLKWAGITGSLTAKRYRELALELAIMAKDNNLKPHELQAIIWTEIRGAAY